MNIAEIEKLVSTASCANRRNSPRRMPRGSVTIEVRKGNLGLGPNLAEIFLDLAEGGIRIVIREELERGDEVEVSISSFGMPKPLKALGTIRWAMRLDNGLYCVGIQFDKRLAYRAVATLFKP